MRYLIAKPRPGEKTPHPSAFGCHLLPPEKAYLYPRPFLPSSRQPSVNNQNLRSSPCRGRRPRRPASNEKLMIYLPSRLRFVWIARSRSIVTHEREYRATFLPRRGRRPRRPATSSVPLAFRQHTNLRSLCLLLWEKGDRFAVDEECVSSSPPPHRYRNRAVLQTTLYILRRFFRK